MQTPRPSIEEIEKLLRSTAAKIQSHSAVINLGGSNAFSGVFVSCFGYHGILTAGHSATQILAAQRFALVLSEAAHNYVVETKDFEHVRIGEYDEFEGYSKRGPDLSFVIIRNENVLRALRVPSVAFYNITTHSIRDVLDIENLDSINWAVAGNPREKVQITNETIHGESSIITVTISAIVQGTLAEYVLDEANNFDYLGLHVGASFEDFPKSYNGVSGGGIWYQKFIRVTESSYVAEPFLAGVACWESEATIKRGWKVRKVTGHGFVSIYSQLRRALYDKWVNE